MLKNFKIGTRLSLGFGILLVLMLVVGGYGIKSIKALHEEIDLLVEDRMVKVEQANAIIDQINIVARAMRNMIIDDNKGEPGKGGSADRRCPQNRRRHVGATEQNHQK